MAYIDPAQVIDLEPGLYFDESARTLPEVTVHIMDWATEAGYDPTEDETEILESVIVDERSGLYRFPDHLAEFGLYLYEALADWITDHLPDGLWFGYLNEAGGWGIWEEEEDDNTPGGSWS